MRALSRTLVHHAGSPSKVVWSSLSLRLWTLDCEWRHLISWRHYSLVDTPLQPLEHSGPTTKHITLTTLPFHRCASQPVSFVPIIGGCSGLSVVYVVTQKKHESEQSIFYKKVWDYTGNGGRISDFCLRARRNWASTGSVLPTHNTVWVSWYMGSVCPFTDFGLEQRQSTAMDRLWQPEYFRSDHDDVYDLAYPHGGLEKERTWVGEH